MSVPIDVAQDNAAWAVAIFASRETPEELLTTLNATLAAAQKPTLIDILINGNGALAETFSKRLDSTATSGHAATVRVWSIDVGDKANAWNQYVHRIWTAGSSVFFMDGYVRPDPDALALLEAGMMSAPDVLGATGIPRAGNSAARQRRQMLEKGGLHGNLYCLRSETVEAIKKTPFYLPLGIYRTDSILGAALKFNLDPAHNQWKPERVQVNPDAGWDTRAKNWWRLSDIKSQMKRILLQAKGDLENRAFRHSFAIKNLPLPELPRTASALVLNWAASCPEDARVIMRRNVFSGWALKKLKNPRDWGGANDAPRLVCTRVLH